ncbi:hypothetical protein [Burkholderia cepacia]|uniref:hypothetical protein n=1 Tax=Burkholderia cepacia TaxID=292 RepID=UPI001576CE49|nr:hypothetical protein [Burkholderia cepacia]NTX20485.1 hypothetical protein [Burkholderia cepacia]
MAYLLDDVVDCRAHGTVMPRIELLLCGGIQLGFHAVKVRFSLVGQIGPEIILSNLSSAL